MNTTAWVMTVHIATLGIWSAALLILAGLYADAPPQREHAPVNRHRVMCRYVFVMLASPAAVLAIISGSLLVYLRGADGSWLIAKLAAVSMLALYHAYCGKRLDAQGMESVRARPRRHSPLLITVPVALIGAILILVLAKPDVMLEYQLPAKPASHRDQGAAQQREIQTSGLDSLQRVFQTG